jgi:hypothetical protein
MVREKKKSYIYQINTAIVEREYESATLDCRSAISF